MACLLPSHAPLNEIGTINDPGSFFPFCPFNFKQIGLGTGISLSMILFLGFGTFSSLFTTDSEVLEIAQSGLLVRNHEHLKVKYLNTI